MDEHDAAPLSVRDNDQNEFEVRDVSAKARWREVRPLFFAGLIIYSTVLLVSWLLWHRTATQLAWIGLGLAAFRIAVLIWKHDLVGFSYSEESSEQIFEGKRSPVPRALATPALILAGALLFLAGTSTSPGRWLASLFGVFKTLFEAGKSGVEIFTIPLVVVVVLLILASMGLAHVGGGIYFLVRFILRGFRSDPECGTGLAVLLMGFIMLGMASFLAIVFIGIIVEPDTVLNPFLERFRTIKSWFA